MNYAKAYIKFARWLIGLILYTNQDFRLRIDRDGMKNKLSITLLKKIILKKFGYVVHLK
jgi:hypothetical protein